MNNSSRNLRLDDESESEKRERDCYQYNRHQSLKSHSNRDRSGDRERDHYRNRDDKYRGNSRRDGYRSNQHKRDYDYNNRYEHRQNLINNGRPSWENGSVKRHAEKIQERKLLWSKAKEEPSTNETSESNIVNSNLLVSGVNNTSKSLESAWTSRLVAATNNTSQISKFQRLMGMKNVSETSDTANTNTSKQDNDLEKERKKQDELTFQLDRQYAMARATTHLGRGKGLGFGS